MHKEAYIKCKKEVAAWMRRLYKKGLTTTLGGNISLRIDESLIAITASASDKGRIKAAHVAIVGADGQCKDEGLTVSMETGMHLAVYRARPDVKAIVHAHAPMGSLFAVIEQSLNTNLLAEAHVILGVPCKAAYAAPGSEQLAANVADASKAANVIIMANHGVLAVGSNLMEAFDRIEVLENAAKMTVLTTLLKDKCELSINQLAELKALLG
ncbi:MULTISPECIES: class II aldolase/adducin family protein [unclassified Carboxylicivirga]|uniref:class II aldolase/adducin family protein n=1 Tax=Carboxylicivirga TaxID=1628153 RepID=UPI003D33847E